MKDKDEIKKYMRTTTEINHSGRVFADTWEWFPVGEAVQKDSLTAQKFELAMIQRERIYKTMPDGSQCWYYADTLKPISEIHTPKGLFWHSDAIEKFLSGSK